MSFAMKHILSSRRIHSERGAHVLPFGQYTEKYGMWKKITHEMIFSKQIPMFSRNAGVENEA
ncbi:MAG: hypothetical protein AAGL90_17825 [Pseudomonadota bacterium]